MRPPCPTPDEPPSSRFLVLNSPHKKPQPLPWDIHHLSPLTEFGPSSPPSFSRVPSRQVPALASPQCGPGRCEPPVAARLGEGRRGRPGPESRRAEKDPGLPSPPDPPAPPRLPALPAGRRPLTAHEPRRRQQPHRQLLEAHPGRAGTASDGHANSSGGFSRRRAPPAPSRGSGPLGAAGALGTSGSSAPSCARTGARPTAPPARAERRDADGPPPRPASRLMDFPPFPKPRESPGRRGGSGAARRLLRQPERCGAAGRGAPGIIEPRAGAAPSPAGQPRPPAPAALPEPAAAPRGALAARGRESRGGEPARPPRGAHPARRAPKTKGCQAPRASQRFPSPPRHRSFPFTIGSGCCCCELVQQCPEPDKPCWGRGGQWKGKAARARTSPCWP